MTVEIGLVIAGIVAGLLLAYCIGVIAAMKPERDEYNPAWMDYEKWSDDRD